MPERTKRQELTDRQLEILNLLRKGLTNGEICRSLDISENTVKVHLANIYKILDVTNRTEAVYASTNLFESGNSTQDVCIVIAHSDEIRNTPLAHSLFLSIIEALHCYHLFQIKLCQMDEETDDCIYRINISVPKDEKQALYISLHQADNSAQLWSNLQKIENSDQIKLLASQNAIQLHHHMMLSATNAHEANPAVAPLWWFASSYATIKMENRSKDVFETCRANLEALLKTEVKKDYISCTLASTYYMAINEHWGDADEFTRRIGEIACATMHETPTSTNSMHSIAIYNILLGNKHEAIIYLEGILIANPLCTKTRKLLAQIYSQVGCDEDARTQQDEFNRYVLQ